MAPIIKYMTIEEVMAGIKPNWEAWQKQHPVRTDTPNKIELHSDGTSRLTYNDGEIVESTYTTEDHGR